MILRRKDEVAHQAQGVGYPDQHRDPRLEILDIFGNVRIFHLPLFSSNRTTRRPILASRYSYSSTVPLRPAARRLEALCLDRAVWLEIISSTTRGTRRSTADAPRDPRALRHDRSGRDGISCKVGHGRGGVRGHVDSLQRGFGIDDVEGVCSMSVLVSPSASDSLLYVPGSSSRSWRSSPKRFISLSSWPSISSTTSVRPSHVSSRAG